MVPAMLFSSSKSKTRLLRVGVLLVLPALGSLLLPARAHVLLCINADGQLSTHADIHGQQDPGHSCEATTTRHKHEHHAEPPQHGHGHAQHEVAPSNFCCDEHTHPCMDFVFEGGDDPFHVPPAAPMTFPLLARRAQGFTLPLHRLDCNRFTPPPTMGAPPTDLGLSSIILRT